MTSLSGKTPTISDDKFPQFDVLSDFSDHHYIKRRPKLTPSSHKKIMQEWKFLSKELPESIFIRVYETRVDLLRAAIVGVHGTPYCDGLFFFDIAFPSDYPSKPPLVHYHSFGYQINPFIFRHGYICLSLLSTWGKKDERWDPKQSTIFQLLLSIQALVLTDHRERLRRTSLLERTPIPYNEEFFVLKCKTMLQVLRAPPKDFEPLVKQHFNGRAKFILNACNAFREGLFDGVVKRRIGDEVSAKFKTEMNMLYGDLVVALASNGASVGQFFERLMEDERKAKEEAVVTTKQNKEGIVVREVGKSVVHTLKKIVVRELFALNSYYGSAWGA